MRPRIAFIAPCCCQLVYTQKTMATFKSDAKTRAHS